MAAYTADDYAAWIVKNQDKKGSKEFDTVAKAYQEAKTSEAVPTPTPSGGGIPGPRQEAPEWAKEYPTAYRAAVTARQLYGPTVEMLGGVLGGAAGAGGVAGRGAREQDQRLRRGLLFRGRDLRPPVPGPAQCGRLPGPQGAGWLFRP